MGHNVDCSRPCLLVKENVADIDLNLPECDDFAVLNTLKLHQEYKDIDTVSPLGILIYF